MNYRHIIVTLLLAGIIAGCGDNSGNTNIVGINDSSMLDGAITLEGNSATLHPQNAPEAVISSLGDLSIDGKSVVTTPAEKTLLAHYFQNVQGIRDNGIAAGKEGVAIAGVAMKSIASGIAKGDTDHVDKEIDAQDKKVEAAALKICDNMDGIKAAQDQLSAQLPAFQPYARIVNTAQITDCRKDDDDDDKHN